MRGGSHRLSSSPAGDETVDDHVAQVVRVAVGGDATRDAGHLFDEVDQVQIEVVFDQGEAGQVDALVGTPTDFLERDPGGLFRRWIDQYHLTSLDMGRRFAIGDRDDLLVLGWLSTENAACELESGLDVGEMLGHEGWGIVERNPKVDSGSKMLTGLGAE